MFTPIGTFKSNHFFSFCLLDSGIIFFLSLSFVRYCATKIDLDEPIFCRQATIPPYKDRPCHSVAATEEWSCKKPGLHHSAAAAMQFLLIVPPFSRHDSY